MDFLCLACIGNYKSKVKRETWRRREITDPKKKATINKHLCRVWSALFSDSPLLSPKRKQEIQERRNYAADLHTC
jgi:hypothetical protein